MILLVCSQVGRASVQVRGRGTAAGVAGSGVAQEVRLGQQLLRGGAVSGVDDQAPEIKIKGKRRSGVW